MRAHPANVPQMYSVRRFCRMQEFFCEHWRTEASKRATCLSKTCLLYSAAYTYAVLRPGRQRTVSCSVSNFACCNSLPLLCGFSSSGRFESRERASTAPLR